MTGSVCGKDKGKKHGNFHNKGHVYNVKTGQNSWNKSGIQGDWGEPFKRNMNGRNQVNGFIFEQGNQVILSLNKKNRGKKQDTTKFSFRGKDSWVFMSKGEINGNSIGTWLITYDIILLCCTFVMFL